MSSASATPGPNLGAKNSDSLFNSESLAQPESLGRIERDEVKAALSHLIANAVLWGIDPGQFRVTEAVPLAAGMSVVRFTQFIDGVEVANSLLAITVTASGSLLSYTKSTSDFSQATLPPIDQEQATESLKYILANEKHISPDISIAV